MHAPDDWSPDNRARVAELSALGLDAASELVATVTLAMVPLLASEGYRDAAYTLERVALDRLRSS